MTETIFGAAIGVLILLGMIGYTLDRIGDTVKRIANVLENKKKDEAAH